jgi:hypothetical protein
MDLCLAKKINGETCNKPTKYVIRLEKEEEYKHPRCGMHLKNIEDINKIKIDEFYQKNKEKDDVMNINEFKEKINITNDNNKEIKKPCLQYIKYLISKDGDDLCQYEDCQFAHNIEIINN